MSKSTRSPARPPARSDTVGGIAVVVPAHDEERRLGHCVDSVHRALDHRLVRSLPRVLVVVLDGCRDRSRAVAEGRARAGDLIVEVGVHNVGAARAAGIAIAIHELGRRGIPPGRTWLANTDADTAVPPWWLARQVSLAERADGVAGVVRVDDWSEHQKGTQARFEAMYGTVPRVPFGALVHGEDAHPHVHGANLGVRGDAYVAAGGFSAVRPVARRRSGTARDTTPSGTGRRR